MIYVPYWIRNSPYPYHYTNDYCTSSQCLILDVVLFTLGVWFLYTVAKNNE